MLKEIDITLENDSNSKESKEYTILFGEFGMKLCKWYLERQLDLFVGRKELFVQESIKEVEEEV